LKKKREGKILDGRDWMLLLLLRLRFFFSNIPSLKVDGQLSFPTLETSPLSCAGCTVYTLEFWPLFYFIF
jgi:hypothetical protein